MEMLKRKEDLMLPKQELVSAVILFSLQNSEPEVHIPVELETQSPAQPEVAPTAPQMPFQFFPMNVSREFFM